MEVLRAGLPVEKILVAERAAISGPVAEIRRLAERSAVPVRVVPRERLDQATEGANHQGVAAFTASYRYAPLEKLLRVAAPALLLLDGVTDPHNLGSLLRSTEVAGFNGVVVPSHRSVGVTDAARRVSAGAAELVDVARVANLRAAIDAAKDAGLWIVGLDERAETDLWTSAHLEPPVGLVLGAEDRGISRLVRESCDVLVSIPAAGRLGPLNVAVAGAVAMFEVARRRSRSATL